MELSPDILVIQECEKLPKHHFPNSDYLWKGRNEHKGLGVMIFGGTGNIDKSYNEDLIYFLPVQTDFGSLLGVWAYNHRSKKFGDETEGHIIPALDYYNSFLVQDSMLGIIGDFNNSVIWDKPRAQYTFESAISQLDDLGFSSVYHSSTSEVFGEETVGTHFHLKKSDRRYHIDYHFLKSTGTITIGDYADWIDFSDHVPVVVDLD